MFVDMDVGKETIKQKGTISVESGPQCSWSIKKGIWGYEECLNNKTLLSVYCSKEEDQKGREDVVPALRNFLVYLRQPKALHLIKQPQGWS